MHGATGHEGLWHDAFNEFKKNHADLFDKSSDLWTRTTDESTKESRVSVPATTNEQSDYSIAAGALDQLQLNKADEATLRSKSKKFQQCWEQTVRLVTRCSDIIALAASAHPIATIAWSAVSALLPLLLANATAKEEAMDGLSFIAILTVEYRNMEAVYLDSDYFEDFAACARKIYVAILKYEADLYINFRASSIKRTTKNLLWPSHWQSEKTTIVNLDLDCKRIVASIDQNRVNDLRNKESVWRSELQRSLAKVCDNQTSQDIKQLDCDYETGKALVQAAPSPNTLQWFFEEQSYLDWTVSGESSFLWLTAEPGCGKSVISRHIVDLYSERSMSDISQSLICYFFCHKNEQSADPIKANVVLQALIHQCLMQKPDLCEYVSGLFKNHKIEHYLNSFDRLWNIFRELVSRAGVSEIVCILDGVDQCEPTKRRTLISKLIELHGEVQKDRSQPVLKIILTSRPGNYWNLWFARLGKTDSAYRICGEEKLTEIGEEIKRVVAHRLESLRNEGFFSEDDLNKLYECITKTANKTYLWLKLVFDYLDFNLTPGQDIAEVIEGIPKTASEGWLRLIEGIEETNEVRTLLRCVIGAARPLKVRELKALLQPLPRFKSSEGIENEIRSLSGYLLVITDGHVEFFHDSARISLLDLSDLPENRSSNPGEKQPLRGFTVQECDLELAKRCIQILLNYLRANANTGSSGKKALDLFRQSGFDALVGYAAHYWTLHYSRAGTAASPDLHVAAADLFTHARSKLWTVPYQQASRSFEYQPLEEQGLSWASYFGLHKVVSRLIELHDVEEEDEYGRTSIFFTAYHGHEGVVKLLLEAGADVNKVDQTQSSPLLLAMHKGHHQIASMLIDQGADPNQMDIFNQTALSYAVAHTRASLHRILFPTEESRMRRTNHEDFAGSASRIPSPNTVTELFRRFINYSHEQKQWKSLGKDRPLYNEISGKKASGLSALFDPLRTSIDFFHDHDYQASLYHAIAALSAIPIVIEMGHPFLVTYIPRILGYCYSKGQKRFALAIVAQMLVHSRRLHREKHPLTQLLDAVHETLSSCADTDAASLIIRWLRDIIATWTDILGLDHEQVKHARHVLRIVNSWFSSPSELIEQLRRESSDLDQLLGPEDQESLRVLLDLGDVQLQACLYESALTTARTVSGRIANTATNVIPPDENIQGGILRPFDPLTHWPWGRTLLLRHFCDAVRIGAEAQAGLGDVESAERLFGVLILRSTARLGTHHSWVKLYRQSFARFSKSQGRLHNASSY